MAKSDCYQYIFKEIQVDTEVMNKFSASDNVFFDDEAAEIRWKKAELWKALWEIVEDTAQDSLTENQKQYWELAKKGFTTQRISALISATAAGCYSEVDEVELRKQKSMTKSGYIPAGVKYGNYITCKLCGKKLSQIHVNHLKKSHADELGFGDYRSLKDISTKEILDAYREMFPDAPIYTEKKNDELGIVTQQGLWDRKRNALKKLRKLLSDNSEALEILQKILTMGAETL